MNVTRATQGETQTAEIKTKMTRGAGLARETAAEGIHCRLYSQISHIWSIKLLSRCHLC